MSLYKKENPAWFEKAFLSITKEQERIPDEAVLVCDGPLTEELDSMIEKCREECPCSVNVVRLSQNKMLGLALAAGLEEAKGDLIARMDTDDIAVPERLKIQEKFMTGHPEIAAVGGEIAEFESEGEVIRTKHMPENPDDIYKYAKKRNPLNHMTVMFRKKDVIEAGSYQHFPLLEDYHLWSRMLAMGKKLYNIPEVLVYARIDSSFSDKRGGKEYFETYKKLRQLQKEWGFLNSAEYKSALAATFVMTRQSSGARDLAYKLLRKR